MHRFYLAIFFTFSFLNFSHADQEANAAIDDFINHLIAEEGPDSIGDSTSLKDNIVQLYDRHGEDERIQDKNSLMIFLNNLMGKKILSAEDTRRYLTHLLSDKSKVAFSDKQSFILLLLHPYVLDSGACQEDESSPDELSCSFIVEPKSGVRRQLG